MEVARLTDESLTRKLAIKMYISNSFAVGYLLTSSISNPRKVARRLVAAFMFLISVIWLLTLRIDVFDGPHVATFALTAFFLTFIALVSVSKMATIVPFSVFTYGRYLVASITTSKTAQVWWGLLASAWAGVLIGAAAGSEGAKVFFMFLTIVAIIGVGVSVIGVEKKVFATAIRVRNEIARVLGAHPEAVEVGNSGNLRSPEYTCMFPMLISPECIFEVEQNILRLLPDLTIVEMQDVGVSLVKS